MKRHGWHGSRVVSRYKNREPFGSSSDLVPVSRTTRAMSVLTNRRAIDPHAGGGATLAAPIDAGH